MDDSEPLVRRSTGGMPRVLDSLSVEELNAYADELMVEVERVRAEIDRKRNYRAGIDSLFKS